MSAPETTGRRMQAVIWDRVGTASNGRPTVSNTPRQIDVRIVSGASDSQSANSSEVGTEAVMVVNEDVLIGSSVWQGTLAAYNALTTAQRRTIVVFEVRTFDKIPDVRCRGFYRKCGLVRKGTTP